MITRHIGVMTALTLTSYCIRWLADLFSNVMRMRILAYYFYMEQFFFLPLPLHLLFFISLDGKQVNGPPVVK